MTHDNTSLTLEDANAHTTDSEHKGTDKGDESIAKD